MVHARLISIGVRVSSVLLSFAALLSWAAWAVAASPLSVETARAPVRQNTVTVDLAVTDPKVGQVQVLSRQGKELPAAPEPVKVAPDATTQVTIPVDRPVILRAPAAEVQRPAPRALSMDPLEFPDVLVESVPVEGAEGIRELRQWSLMMRALRTPLPWDGKRYSTELLVGLWVKDSSDGTVRLDQPVFVQLVGTNVVIEPSRLELTASGVSGFRSAQVAIAKHRDMGTIEAVSDFGTQIYTVATAPAIATLALEVPELSIAGFGLGTTDVAVVRRAEDGLDLLGMDPLTVTLNVTGGHLSASTITVEEKKSHSGPIQFRSAWLGAATVTASGDGITSQPILVRFLAPWTLFAAMTLGAAAGSYVRVVRVRSGRSRGRAFLQGFAAGIAAALASFVGVTSTFDLPATATATEVGCFLVAMVEAYAGRWLLDRMAAGSAGRRARMTPQETA